ncbi:HAMP domain-containing methyl-accepting chemotaxis protein [Allorhizobium sp. BGMRC 0089]|uniref:methyl-accepting chemotaxis protein n=1 Tax=Allorhizobium sonneratiae TaxID=2934936 RepID=UPI0020342496|nr:HAMP domain-containing methyl-accepting chemotaxis protein [Allorhizobium sonneratiae]MCM2290724.1 HAMP domain-containing methyl-accepting chemotaxis protein [Allorhizobium sonneratiae]
MFSIRNILISVLFVLGVALGVQVSFSLYASYKNYSNYQAVTSYTSLDKALFTILLNYRLERGRANTIFLTKLADTPPLIAQLEGFRNAVDSGMKDFMAVSGNFSQDKDVSQWVDKVKEGYQAINTYRADMDSQFKLENTQRNVLVNDKQFKDGGQYIKTLENSSLAVEGKIRSLDNSLTDILQIRANSWAARSAAGTESIYLTKTATTGKPLTAAEVATLARQDAIVTMGFNQAAALIDHPNTPPDLKAVLAQVNAGYNQGRAFEMRDAMYKKAIEHQPVDYAAADWIGPSNEAQAALAELPLAAMKSLNDEAHRKMDRAFNDLIFYAGLLLAVIAIIVVGFLVVVKRVVSSISSLTAAMKVLADGNTDLNVPFNGRADEIGDMARSVEIFRQAAIRNKDLEAHTEENRRRGETERIELQRKAEEEANMRLDAATGALASGLQRLASGDLLCEIDETFAPQFEALRHDFNTSVRQLRQVLLAVGQSANMVRGGSDEISQASDNLAKRTEQQAASLEETAAALEEITSNVKATSQRSREARDIVRNTWSKAEHSGVVVNNAVTAMSRIEQASQQITQIIGVIDEIAFQTNLLALNAGVEAARAGDAGKGFAVVAQEVRELAQRSANAAKEIKGLIANSSVAVNEGVKLVNDTGNGLSEIATLVQSVNEHMDAIATAAQEQSSGLSEVNTAVNHMDQATQQNAAMVEEMNAAGAGLAEESIRLSELLARFKTAEQAANAEMMRNHGQRRLAG